MHATALLSPNTDKPRPFVVLKGDEPFLKRIAVDWVKRHVLGKVEDANLGLLEHAGKGVQWKDVVADLRTVSMFGGGGRLVLVREADEFVSAFRPQLEAYADKPSQRAVLVLEVKTFPATTKLAKKIAATGTEVDCSVLSGPALNKWLVDAARDRFGKQLARDAAALMIELAGTGLTLLDQELTKVVSYVGDRPKITAEEVRKLVGGWKGETTWTMLNAVRDGQLALALGCLDQLLTGGEAPQKILGGINYVYRKLANATEQARNTPLRVALKEAGVFPRDIDPTERYLRRLGRQRADSLTSKLVSLDRGLKGGDRTPERVQLENLLVWLAGA